MKKIKFCGFFALCTMIIIFLSGLESAIEQGWSGMICLFRSCLVFGAMGAGLGVVIILVGKAFCPTLLDKYVEAATNFDED